MEDETQILELLETSEADSKWVSEKYDELQKRYEGKVFAVKNKTILSHADTIEELLSELEKKSENMGFLLIEAVPPRNVSFIL